MNDELLGLLIGWRMLGGDEWVIAAAAGDAGKSTMADELKTILKGGVDDGE